MLLVSVHAPKYSGLAEACPACSVTRQSKSLCCQLAISSGGLVRTVSPGSRRVSKHKGPSTSERGPGCLW